MRDPPDRTARAVQERKAMVVPRLFSSTFLWLAARVAAGMMLLVAMSCDSDSLTLEEFLDSLLGEYCANVVRCGDAPDETTCRGSVYRNLQLPADVESGKIRYDSRAARECLVAVRAYDCQLSTKTPEPTSCNEALRGTIAEGGSCLDSSECASRNCNLDGCAFGTCCAGLCEAQAAFGAACRSGVGACVPGAYCKTDGVTATGTCVAELGAGEACRLAFDECSPNLACVVADSTSGIGTCSTLPAEGQPCTTYQCDDNRDVCDQTTTTCVRRLAIGASCVTGVCPPYAACDMTTKTCVTRTALGGACSTSNSCVAGSCQNGVCTKHADQPACP